MLRMIGGALLVALPTLFLLIFFVYPVLTLWQVSFFGTGGLDLSGFERLLTRPYYREVLAFTTGQAALSTAVTLALALPAAGVFARWRWPGKSALLALTTLPFVLPPVVVAAALLALIGERGLINDLLLRLPGVTEPPLRLERTLTVIVIAHVFYNFAIALRLIAGYWAAQSPRLEEAARISGAGWWRLWWQIRLPLLRPALTSAALLVFIFNFTSFGVILILGGSRFTTLEVEIYTQALSLFNLPLAGALAVTQIMALGLLMIVYTRVQRGLGTVKLVTASAARRPDSRRAWLGVIAVSGGIALGIFAPLAALIVRSVTVDGGFALTYYAALGSNPRGSVLFVPPLTAIGNSFGYAAVTTVIAVGLGVCAAYALAVKRRLWFDLLLTLPLATSAVTLGFGFIIALDEPPLNLRTSPLLIPLAHTLAALPFVVRSVLPALRGIPPSLREAAATLGASRWTVWRWVDLPLVGRGALVGASFAFTVSMGEFGASLFVARPDAPTIPIVIYRLLGQPGALNYGQALALSAILLIVCAVVFLVIERVRIGEISAI